MTFHNSGKFTIDTMINFVVSVNLLKKNEQFLNSSTYRITTGNTATMINCPSLSEITEQPALDKETICNVT